MVAINQPVICLLGPTASGKTDLACGLCDKYPLDIISVDSALVYRGMDIGTAKPDQDTLQRYPHQLVDIRDPAEPYSAADFKQEAAEAIAASHAAGRVPLLVGGTMLYFKALLQGLSPLPSADEAFRRDFNKQWETEGAAAMHGRLRAVDPVAADKIHQNDPQRIGRALEVYTLTGQPLSVWWETAEQATPYEALCQLILWPADRTVLHARIEKRFHEILGRGFAEEVRVLQARGDLSLDLPSMRAVGYQQMWRHLLGEYDEATMIARSVVATRQLAKRQLTWLRQWQGGERLDPQRVDLDIRAQKTIDAFLHSLRG